MKTLKECLRLSAAVALHVLNYVDYKARPNRNRRGF